MDNLKQNLKRQLVANILKDKCKNNSNLIYDDSLCSADRVIRFSVQKINRLISKNTDKKFFMFECDLTLDPVCIRLLFYPKLATRKIEIVNKIRDISKFVCEDYFVVNEWKFSCSIENENKLFCDFDDFMQNKIFEFILQLKNNIFDENTFLEGKKFEVLHQSFERNKEARKKCLEFYGYACQICGFDFGKFYGKDFENIIEVHHIVPISTIGKGYILDPIKDLIPVCPNCHSAIHSKHNGVYLPNEIKQLLSAQNSNNNL